MSRMNTEEFMLLMGKLAQAWSQQDTQSALDCFSEDAIYMEPPDVQLYLGHKQLRPYFRALQPGTFMEFHQLWFDESTQVGAGVYTFGLQGKETADHGVTIVEIRNRVISTWREYQRKGPADFKLFNAHEGKSFQWHIGNYP